MDLSERAEAAIEVRHPWESARCTFLLDVLSDHGVLARTREALDVGAGDGYFATRLLESLPSGASVTCWDPGYAKLPFGRLGTPRGLELSATAPRGRKFDLLLLMDVLEHIDDDAAYVREQVASHLRPGGYCLVTVPAWPFLFSSHDRALKHQRRYTPSAAVRLLTGAGLRVEESAGLFLSLCVPRALRRLREGRAAAEERSRSELLDWKGGPTMTAFIERILLLDGAVGRQASRRGGPLPGLSWWGLCRNP